MERCPPCRSRRQPVVADQHRQSRLRRPAWVPGPGASTCDDRRMTAGAGRPVDRAPELHRSGRAAGARTLIDILGSTVRRHPDAVAVDDASTVLTYRELAREVDRRAARL